MQKKQTSILLKSLLFGDTAKLIHNTKFEPHFLNLKVNASATLYLVEVTSTAKTMRWKLFPIENTVCHKQGYFPRRSKSKYLTPPGEACKSTNGFRKKQEHKVIAFRLS